MLVKAPCGMSPSPNLRRQAVAWALILALWTLLVLAFTGALVFVRGLDWPDALNISLHNWYPWLFLAPAVAWLGFKFPFERNKLRTSIPMHVLGCALAAVVMALSVGPPQMRPGGPMPGGANTPPRLEGQPRAPFRGPPGGRPPLDTEPGVWPLERGMPQPGFGPRRDRVPLSPRNQFLNVLMFHGQMSVPVYWVIVSIVQALRFYQRSQERERRAAELESRLAQAKLQALRAQLQPHFLFNTLNAISMLVHKDANAADEMIASLSDLLRASLNTTETEISLAREIELVNKYVAIQQVRFADRLRVEKHLEAAALEARVPALILQPLVENAIRHGLEPKTGPGLLEIRASREDDCVRITVRDNGVGAKNPGGDAGIGLGNTRDRLRELYGERAQLVLSSGSQGGFTAELLIPTRRETGPEPRI